METLLRNGSNIEGPEYTANNIEGHSVQEGVDFVFSQNPILKKIGTPEQYSQYLATIFPDSQIKNIVYHGTSKGRKKLPILKIPYGSSIHNFSETDRNNHVIKRGYKRANDIGYYFSPSPEKKFKAYHNSFQDFSWDGAKNYGREIYPAILDLKKPTASDFALSLTEELKTELKHQGYDSVVAISDDMTSAGIGREMELVRPIDNPNAIVEYIVFDHEQVHVLGSKQDIKQFEVFCKN